MINEKDNPKKPKRLGEDRNVTFLEFNRVSSEDDPMKVTFMPPTVEMEARQAACAHQHTWIHEKEHRLQCAGCKEYLDPLTWLKRFAERERTLDWRIDAINEYEKKGHEARLRDNRKRDLKYRKLPQGKTKYGRVTVVVECIDIDKSCCKHEVYLSQLWDIKATEEFHVTLQEFERRMQFYAKWNEDKVKEAKKTLERLGGGEVA